MFFCSNFSDEQCSALANKRQCISSKSRQQIATQITLRQNQFTVQMFLPPPWRGGEVMALESEQFSGHQLWPHYLSHKSSRAPKVSSIPEILPLITFISVRNLPVKRYNMIRLGVGLTAVAAVVFLAASLAGKLILVSFPNLWLGTFFWQKRTRETMKREGIAIFSQLLSTLSTKFWTSSFRWSRKSSLALSSPATFFTFWKLCLNNRRMDSIPRKIKRLVKLQATWKNNCEQGMSWGRLVKMVPQIKWYSFSKILGFCSEGSWKFGSSRLIACWAFNRSRRVHQHFNRKTIY